MNTAIFVACIASFRSLYCQSKSSRQEETPQSYPLKEPSARRILASTFGTDTVLGAENSYWARQPSHDSREGLWNAPDAAAPEVGSSPSKYQCNIVNT